MDSASWDKAKNLIADALKLPASERVAFLADKCPDPVVRAKVDALLKQYDDGRDFLEHRPAIDEPAFEAEFEDLVPGARVGPYVILDRLGRGGMGQVFLGSDPRLNRKVALKCLIASSSAVGDWRPRILREARAAAGISHPNIATVHDVVEHEARAFIVMEYVEGESLAARLKRDRIPIDQVVAIGRQLAAALAAAHAQGIVHRDLKPANIQLTPGGSVKVLDFGIAKAIAALATTAGESSTTSPSLGPRGQPGTPGYMSPEQMLGRDVDERSDIFNLGLILFEMATGRRPYSGTDALDLIIALAKQAPRADAADPAVPRELADVIARSLELDLEERFQSAAAVGAALAAIERGVEPDLPTTQPMIAPLRVPMRRRLARVAAMCLLGPLLIGVLGLVSTTAFNITFGRTGAFASEPVHAYFVWGSRSLVAPLFTMTATVVLVLAMKFVLRLLRLSGQVDRAVTSLTNGARRRTSRIGLDDPAVLSQALATLGVASLAVLWWRHADLITAWGSFISTASAATLAPLEPGNAAERHSYRIVLAVLILAFGAGLFRVVQLRGRQTRGDGTGALIVLVAVVAVLVLMAEWPYRIFFQNEAERIELAGARCYIVGEAADDLLVYCPDTKPPRNRVVKRSDPSIHRLGVVESVFTRAAP